MNQELRERAMPLSRGEGVVWASRPSVLDRWAVGVVVCRRCLRCHGRCSI